MRTGSHDFFDAIHVQHLNVGHRQHLKCKLVTGSPGRVTRATFLRPQYSKFDPGLI
jgi:hypothetical protein